jgi:hypothetical protein
MLKAKLIITSDTNDSSVVVVFGSGAQVWNFQWLNQKPGECA